MVAFWKWLETRSDRTAVMAEWRQAAGDCAHVLSPWLRPLERLATAFPNPRPWGQPMQVVRHRSGDVVAVDPDDAEHRLALSDVDVVLYQLDLGALRSSLCPALEGMTVSRTPVEPDARVVRVGNWEPKKAAHFPVDLLLCRHRGALRGELLELQARCDRPGAIVLTPSRVNWDEQLDALARSRRMLLVPLEEVIAPDGDVLHSTRAWEAYLRAFAQMVQLTLPSNYHNKHRLERRASLMAKAEKLKAAMVEHIRSARDGVVANIDAENGVRLMRFLSKTDLARLAGVEPYHVTRCFRADPQLKPLYDIANDPEQLLRYSR